jgi:hypothetical protein
MGTNFPSEELQGKDSFARPIRIVLSRVWSNYRLGLN